MPAPANLHVTSSPDYMVEWSELDVGVGRSIVVCTSAWTAFRRLEVGSIWVVTGKKELEEENGQYILSYVRA
jgi:hypothetical protein